MAPYLPQGGAGHHEQKMTEVSIGQISAIEYMRLLKMSENKRYFTYEYLKDYFGFPAGAQPSESIDRLVMRNHTSNRWFR
ncbi:hypothetical protein IVB11_00705 [Bradyrhizobium sp. 177]|uniref:hypothetical protein n=1 Tax=Bradyrhizobium sp. 177 TaxID=2782647 RepID=UPI001FFA969E|nr:hypothetical protein [Bradyrhizobium sp. 177]MCK1547602.1 hypothetical protein [Bradyrhizobium sp. 177]